VRNEVARGDVGAKADQAAATSAARASSPTVVVSARVLPGAAPTANALPTEPTDAKDPIEPTDAKDPIEPIDAAEAMDPIESHEAADPRLADEANEATEQWPNADSQLRWERKERVAGSPPLRRAAMARTLGGRSTARPDGSADAPAG
jgi:hypothetical protein